MKKRLSEKLDSGIHVLTGRRETTVVLVPGWPEPEVLAHRLLDFIKHVEGSALLKLFLFSLVLGCAVGLLYAALRVERPAPPHVASRSGGCLGRPWANSVLCQPLS
jgi:Protein of unknown function (DUF1427)